jgi:methanogenic corrinoid protein MtbC1
VTANPVARPLSAQNEHRRRYLAYLEDGDEYSAVAFANELLDRGVPAEWILLGLVAPAQAIVGARWAANEWSVAQEHAATYVSERVVGAVAQRTPDTGRRGTLVLACVDGEWHALPARIFGEVMRLHGWRVRFLGASVPTNHLVSYLHQHGPDAVAVSCALPTRLTRAQRLVEACQAAGYPVLAGGRGLGPHARWGHCLGADALADSPAAALRELATWPPPLSARPRPTATADDEHHLILRQRDTLVERGMAELTAAFAPLGAYDDHQRERTREDLGYIVDFLAAAVLVDDPELFTDFISWMCRLLAARRVPARSVGLVLATYDRALYDFPRARTVLSAGITEIDRFDNE